MAHWLNLAAKGVVEDNAVLDKVGIILKWFRNNHKAHGAMRARNLKAPPTTCDTRWSTNFKLVEYYNSHWGQLADICATILRPGDPVRRDLENTQIRRGSEDVAVQLGPIATELAKTQSDSFTLAECTASWMGLLQAFPRQAFKVNYGKVVERSKLALEDPIFLSAYLFHHTYNGVGLEPSQVGSATAFARSNGVDGTTITHYLAQNGPFAKTLFEQQVDEVSWWTASRRYGFPPALCDLALRLHQATATSAALERQLSTLKLSYGSLRTRLGIERARKLSFIQRSVNTMGDIDMDDDE